MLAPILSLALVVAAAPDAGPQVVDAGAPDSLAMAVATVDGGALDLDGGVPPDADLRVELAPRLTDFRVRLLDGSGHQVTATENVRLDAHTHVVIHPDPALQPGTSYTLAVEPDASDAIRDASGRTYPAFQLKLRTSGEPPKKKAKPSRRRHRHH